MDDTVGSGPLTNNLASRVVAIVSTIKLRNRGTVASFRRVVKSAKNNSEKQDDVAIDGSSIHSNSGVAVNLDIAAITSKIDEISRPENFKTVRAVSFRSLIFKTVTTPRMVNSMAVTGVISGQPDTKLVAGNWSEIEVTK